MNLVGKKSGKKVAFQSTAHVAVCEIVADMSVFRNHSGGDSKATPFEIPFQSCTVIEPSVELHLSFMS